jgi:hypothetical protein
MTGHIGRRKSQVFTHHESARQAAFEIMGRKLKREAKAKKPAAKSRKNPKKEQWPAVRKGVSK